MLGVVHQDGRRHVVAVGNAVVFIEAARGRQIPRQDAQVPFAHAHRAVTGRLQHLCDRHFIGREAARVGWLEHCRHAAAHAIASRKDRRPRRRTDRVRGIELAELNAFAGHAVEVGCVDLRTVAARDLHTPYRRPGSRRYSGAPQNHSCFCTIGLNAAAPVFLMNVLRFMASWVCTCRSIEKSGRGSHSDALRIPSYPPGPPQTSKRRVCRFPTRTRVEMVVAVGNDLRGTDRERINTQVSVQHRSRCQVLLVNPVYLSAAVASVHLGNPSVAVVEDHQPCWDRHSRSCRRADARTRDRGRWRRSGNHRPCPAARGYARRHCRRRRRS